MIQFDNYSPQSLGWPQLTDSSVLADAVIDGVNIGPARAEVIPIFTEFIRRVKAKHPGFYLVTSQCGCFNPGAYLPEGGISFHQTATAMDFNWGHNAMYTTPDPASDPLVMPADCEGIAEALGLQWGGSWSYPQDWMHVEFHGTPADAAAVVAQIHNQPEPIIPSVTPKELESMSFRLVRCSEANRAKKGTFLYQPGTALWAHIPSPPWIAVYHTLPGCDTPTSADVLDAAHWDAAQALAANCARKAA